MSENKEQKIVTNIYAVFCVSLLMMLVPLAQAALLASLMFIGIWIAAYVVRSKAEENSLTEDHMTYIIRTIWITSLFSLITVAIASAYILSVYDRSMMLNCAGNVTAEASMQAIQNAFAPCMDEFLHENMAYFINGTVVAAGPLVIYLAYRLAKGITRATKGHRIGDTKNWF